MTATGGRTRRVEPTAVRLSDTPLAGELVNATYSVGFYLACAGIGLLPRRVGSPLLERYVSWAASMDEGRSH